MTQQTRFDSQMRVVMPLTDYEYDRPIRIGMIPDTHNDPDHRAESLKVMRAVGQLFKDEEVDVVVHIGDFNDLGSLSSYDKNTRSFEGRRLNRDLRFSRDCLDTFNNAFGGSSTADKYITLGNHEERLFRLYNDHAELHGIMGDDPFGYEEYGFESHSFLSMLGLNDVLFSHYFTNPNSIMGGVVSGTMDNCLKNLGHSFVMGHQQVFKAGQMHRGNGRIDCGLVAGACYIPDHAYKGPQGNSHWKGCIILDNVDDGYFDMHTYGLKSLIRRYYG